MRCIEHKISKFSPAALYSAVWGRKSAPQALQFCVFEHLNSDLQRGKRTAAGDFLLEILVEMQTPATGITSDFIILTFSKFWKNPRIFTLFGLTLGSRKVVSDKSVGDPEQL